MTNQTTSGVEGQIPAGLKVLLAEPDRMVGDYAAAGLAQHGYHIIRAVRPDDIRRLKNDQVTVDMVISDDSLLKLTQTLFDRPNPPEALILLIGLPQVQEFLPLVGREINDLVVKPFNTDQLALIVERVILDRRMQQTLESFKQTALRLQEENQRLKTFLNQRIPGGIEGMPQNSGSGDSKDNARHDVLQSYAEQTHLAKSSNIKPDMNQQGKKDSE